MLAWQVKSVGTVSSDSESVEVTTGSDQKDQMLKLGGKLDAVGAGISKLTSGVEGLMVQVVGQYLLC